MENVTQAAEAKIAQHRKNAFAGARLAARCIQEKDGWMTPCYGCTFFRICREIKETL